MTNLRRYRQRFSGIEASTGKPSVRDTVPGMSILVRVWGYGAVPVLVEMNSFFLSVLVLVGNRLLQKEPAAPEPIVGQDTSKNTSESKM